MTNQQFKNIMVTFLKKSYPISRVKTKRYFKRGIVLDNGVTYLLGSDLELLSLQYKLMEILYTVFNLDEKTNKDAIDEFLNLNK